MRLIDTHSHIYEDDFQEDIDAVIQRFEKEGVFNVFLPNIDSESIPKMHALEAKRGDLFHPMMGLHPTSVKGNYKEELEIINHWLSEREYCAIGETGIDLYWDKSFLKEQIEAFETQIQWAVEKEIPIIIHCRESFEVICNSLKKFDKKRLKGIFHSFSGDRSAADEIFRLGNFLLGINGVVTFKNAGLDKTVAQLPLEKIVLETDAPYLTPIPHRGKRNEPAYLILIAKKIAEITGKTLEEIAEITTKNAKELF